MRPKKSDINNESSIIDDLTKSEIDKKILELRIKGYTIVEISKLLNKSQKYVEKTISEQSQIEVSNMINNYDMQILELQQIKKSLWKHINTNPSGCAEKLVKTIEQINKMLGLYALSEKDNDNPLLIHLTGNKKQAETINDIKIENNQIDLMRKKQELIPLSIVQKQISNLTQSLSTAMNLLQKQFGEEAKNIVLNAIKYAQNIPDEIIDNDNLED